MRSAYMSRRQAEALFDGMDIEFDAVSAVQAEAVVHGDGELSREVWDLLDGLAAELAADEFAALARVPRFTDREHAARTHRRAVRVSLRSLPVRLGEVA